VQKQKITILAFFISDIPNEPDESFDYYSSKGIYSAKEFSQRPVMDSPKSTHIRIPSANINISIKEQDGNGPETVTRTNRMRYAEIKINDPTQIDTANTEDNGTKTNTNENNGTNKTTKEDNGSNTDTNKDNGTNKTTNEDNGTDTNTNDTNGTNNTVNEDDGQLVEAENYAKPNKPNSHENSETIIPPNPTTPLKRRFSSFKDSAFYESPLETVEEDE